GVAYCDVTLPSFLTWAELRQGNSLVIGGSSTTRSLLRSLVQRHQVDPPRITVAYRGEGRVNLVRDLRRVLGEHGRLRVQRYDEGRGLNAMSRAEFLFLCCAMRGATLKP